MIGWNFPKVEPVTHAWFSTKLRGQVLDEELEKERVRVRIEHPHLVAKRILELGVKCVHFVLAPFKNNKPHLKWFVNEMMCFAHLYPYKVLVEDTEVHAMGFFCKLSRLNLIV